MAKILIVDDEDSVCSLLRKLFEPEGYEVFTETDALKVLELLKEERPDCVLLDVKMPNMNGIELLAKIKEVDRNIAVIMITGYGNLESAIESMKLGTFDYITKPFDLEFIKGLVRRSLQAKEKK